MFFEYKHFYIFQRYSYSLEEIKQEKQNKIYSNGFRI